MTSFSSLNTFSQEYLHLRSKEPSLTQRAQRSTVHHQDHRRDERDTAPNPRFQSTAGFERGYDPGENATCPAGLR